MAPCANGNCANGITNATEQIQAILNATSYLGTSDFIWISVNEGKWTSNKVQNQKFFEELFIASNNLSGCNGVMSSKAAWEATFGANYVVPSSIKLDAGVGAGVNLWWVHWNGKADKSGFVPFGNYYSENDIYLHQYAGQVTTNNCAEGVPLGLSVY